MERPANVESKATLQIKSPYFVAVLVLDEDRERVVRADRELDFMVGWMMEKVMSYVHVQKWDLESLSFSAENLLGLIGQC